MRTSEELDRWLESPRVAVLGESADGRAYLVDDMVFGEADALAIFEADTPDERREILGGPEVGSVGETTGPLISDAPFGPISYRGAPTIDYCFAATDTWGQWNGNDVDGWYVAPPLEPVVAAIDRAAQIWGGVANIRFRHRWDLDGPACDVDLRHSGDIEFWIGHWDGASGGPGSTGNTAVAPMPSAPHDFQRLLVPPAGIGVPLAIHELGHVLGFRHEHERDDATPRCFDIRSYAVLTEFDTQSVMIYADCTQGPAILGLPYPSRLDGIGARFVYGEPHWWWSEL